MILKGTIIILIVFLLLGCKSKNLNRIELISTSGRALDYKNTDSLILGIFVHAYAQIDKNGNCKVLRKSEQDNNLFNSFQIDRTVFETIVNRLRVINSDTLLTESKLEFYDGPTIQLFVHRDNGIVNKLTFIKSKRADKDFLKLYKHIDSVSFNKGDRPFDTSRLKLDRDKLINQIKQNILKTGNTFNRDTIVIIK
jgi:hypothetical protein